MIRRHNVYTGALFGWLLVTFGGIIAAYTGNAEPYVSQPPLFFGQVTPIALIAVAWLGGWLVVRQLRILDWRSAGTGANLTPEGSGLLGKADFTGTVSGRSVRSFLHVEGGGDSGGTTYTVVQAELSEPVEDGVIVGPVADGGKVQPFELEDNADVIDDQLAAVGGSEAAAQAVVSGRARDALLAVDRLNQVYVGDTSIAFEDLERTKTIGGESYEVKQAITKTYDEDYDYWGEWTGDASTVSHITKGEVFDADELHRQVEAVAAVAEAFESATPAGRAGRRS